MVWCKWYEFLYSKDLDLQKQKCFFCHSHEYFLKLTSIWQDTNNDDKKDIRATSTVLQDIVHGQNKMLQSLTLRHMVAVVKHLICVTTPRFE